MARVVHLPDLPRPGGPTAIEFGADAGEFARLWRLLLAMAVRDQATSLHWHPWRAADALAYVAGGVRYTLVRPPAEVDAGVSAAARELVAPGRVWSAAGRWLGWPAAGRFRCAGRCGPSDWCGVWWTAGGVGGAEFLRMDVAVGPVVEAAPPVTGPHGDRAGYSSVSPPPAPSPRRPPPAAPPGRCG